MCSSFSEAPCTEPSISQISAEIQCLRNFFLIMGKIYQQDFPKATVSKRSVKGAISSSFRKAPTHSLLSVKIQQKRNALTSCSKY